MKIVTKLLIVGAMGTGVYQLAKSLPKDLQEIKPTGKEAYVNLSSDYIFDQKKLHKFYIEIPKASLNKLDAKPTKEEYVAGKLTFNGETISTVGVRYKGGKGQFFGGVDSASNDVLGGKKKATKLSMKIKIDYTHKKLKFYGMEKLQFHCMNTDNTQMHERLGYYLFNEMGVKAPRAVHSELYVNGEFIGLFVLVEQIDKNFVKRNFDGKGNIYKGIWPINSQGNVLSKQEFIDALQNNKKSPNVDVFYNIASTIAKAPDDSLKYYVNKYMDVKATMNYVAVDRFIKNDDGAFHWYCQEVFCLPHNLYWFVDEKKQKMYLIPWDLDDAFTNINVKDPTVTFIADDWGHITNDCVKFTVKDGGVYQKSAACDRIVRGLTMFKEEYEQAKTELTTKIATEEAISKLLAEWKEQISVATRKSFRSHDDAQDYFGWENNVDTLKEKVSYARIHF